MMKKLLLHTIVWIPIITITLLIFNSLNKSSQEDWKTYQLKEKKITKHQTTQTEKKEARLPLKKTNQYERNFPTYQNRRIINPKNKEIFWDEITFSNKIDPNWKDKLAKNLLSMQRGETKVFIKEELKLIKIVKESARYLDRVTITYLKGDGRRTSFSAYADSQTGEVIETWNRTRFEHIRRKRIE